MSELFHNHMLGLESQQVVPETDFIGFTFNGVHSSDLGIVRTSEGARYNENLLPTIQDKTVQIPGGDGMYFYGSYYTQKPFNVSFAFDSLTEEQFARLKTVLGDKKPHDLIFDEAPYKIYKAKITESATMKYIPFSEGETNRVYKGEGSVQFTAYQPYARSRFKYLDQITDDMNIRNQIEWKDASRMYESASGASNETGTNYDSFTNGICYLYNAGDLDTDFTLDLTFSGNTIASGTIALRSSDVTHGQMVLKQIQRQGSDAKIRINSKLNLIEGIDANGYKTGNVYNNYITAGTFFKIPPGGNLTLQVSQATYSPVIAYDYLYY